MNNKIKSLISFVAILAFAFPMVVGAQFYPDAGGGTGLPANSITNIIMSVMYWLLYIIAFLGVIGFVIAGILYLTAAGDDTRIEKAKNAMISAIIGIVVAIAGLVAINFAVGLLSANNRL